MCGIKWRPPVSNNNNTFSNDTCLNEGKCTSLIKSKIIVVHINVKFTIWIPRNQNAHIDEKQEREMTTLIKLNWLFNGIVMDKLITKVT